MTSIDDIARRANVASSTVSRALRGLPTISEATRLRVEAVAAELNYIPSSSAAGLASGRTKALGVVVPAVNNWFYGNVIEGVDEAARAAGYDLVLFSLDGASGNRRRMFERALLKQRVDALIVTNVGFSSLEQAELAALRVPTVLVGGAQKGIPRVGIDEVEVARAATNHLISLGHRRIACLGARERLCFNPDVPRRRGRGFRKAMSDAGLAVEDGWTRTGEPTADFGRRAMADILQSSPIAPTAVFCTSDDLALGAMIAAQSLGLVVPRDLSIIGIDDQPHAALLGLTTMAQDPRDQGRTATEIALADLDGRPVDPGLLEPSRFTLTTRTSTSVAPA
jgi:DNA-binding LacI/PurR family transcriptional regulator